MALPTLVFCDTSFFDVASIPVQRSGCPRLSHRREVRLHLVAYGDPVREEAEQLFRAYARDHRLSFCDALSFVVITTLLNHAPCLTFDDDFRGLGLTVLS